MTESFPEALSDTCMSFKLSSNADTGILMLDNELVGKVTEIYPTHKFSYPPHSSKAGEPGRVKTVVLENAQQKGCHFPWSKYKIVMWGKAIDKLSFSPGSSYRIINFKQVLRKKHPSSQEFYPYDIHFMKKTEISEVLG